MGLSLNHLSTIILLAFFSNVVLARDIRSFSKVQPSSAPVANQNETKVLIPVTSSSTVSPSAGDTKNERFGFFDGLDAPSPAASPSEDDTKNGPYDGFDPSSLVTSTENDGYGLYSHQKDTYEDQQQQQEDDKYVESLMDDSDDGYTEDQQEEEDNLVKNMLDGYDSKSSGGEYPNAKSYVQQEQDLQLKDNNQVKNSRFSEISNGGKYSQHERDQQREEDDMVKTSLGGYSQETNGVNYPQYGKDEKREQDEQREEDDMVKKSIGGYREKPSSGKYEQHDHGQGLQNEEEDDDVYNQYGKQGISDTRYLDEGKYFYDVQKDEERHYNNYDDNGGYEYGKYRREYRRQGRNYP